MLLIAAIVDDECVGFEDAFIGEWEQDREIDYLFLQQRWRRVEVCMYVMVLSVVSVVRLARH